MAFAVLETAGFLAALTGLAAALTAFAGAALAGVVAALGASFFAVAMIEIPFDLFGESVREDANTEPLHTCIAANYQRYVMVMLGIKPSRAVRQQVTFLK
jgi:hypothetical protein